MKNNKQLPEEMLAELKRMNGGEPAQAQPEAVPMDQGAAMEQPGMGQQQSKQMPEGLVLPEVPARTIGVTEIQEARNTLNLYRQGKENLEQNVIENQQWYQQRHWDVLRKTNTGSVEPTSGWLFNAIQNKHADAMDNIPAPSILPREEADKAEAQMLSSIVPVILEEAGFEEVYDQHTDNKIRSGTGIYGVFWDASKRGGIGDVAVKEIDILNIFWEPGIQSIQDSRNVFTVELWDREVLEELYPQCKGKMGDDSGTVKSYVHDDNIDTSKKAAVIDWYYKRGGKLHYCKFLGDYIIFASENEAEYRDTGWYAHGKYPFVFDPLYRMKGYPCGFGLIDVGKSAQEYIDRANQAIQQNLLANTRPRYFVRSDGTVNEKEFADYTKDFVHVEGSLGDSIQPIVGKPLSPIYYNVMDGKINELKEVTGNRDVSTGGSTSGVTAASAIAAMQEAGSKLSRDSNKASYRAFREVCLLVIELIRQFYTLPRCFRVLGESGQEAFVQYSNAALNHQADENGRRIPLFDVEITAAKQSPYSKLSQNELAIQFYNAGFFNPQMAEQALACLDMMDFDRKSIVVSKIQKNAQMYQQMQMMQQQLMGMAGELDGMQGSNLQQQVMDQAGMMAPGVSPGGASASGQTALGDERGGEAKGTKNARQRVADSTSPG